MPITFWGGPFDGTQSDNFSELPNYIVALNYSTRPIYKKACCDGCACRRDTVPYVFIGYESADSAIVAGAEIGMARVGVEPTDMKGVEV